MKMSANVKLKFHNFSSLSSLIFVLYLRYDYLKITNDKHKTFGLLCGVRRDTFIIVTGEYAQLTFHSDSDFQGRGFFISFTVVPNPGKYCGIYDSLYLQGIGLSLH